MNGCKNVHLKINQELRVALPFVIALLRDAMLRTVSIANEAGIFARLVHAISDGAKKFYLSRGFVESPLQPMTLIMTLETIRLILAEPDK